ncbi:MAG: tetratricopeptide repeat protein [Bacteroidetes bacterium]|nr:tetratricopeptide repeat protein [Bacteroidota bacterium]
MSVPLKYLLLLCFAGLLAWPARAQHKDYLAEGKQETDPVKKLELFRLAVQHTPSDLAWFYLGATLNQLERYRQAQEALEEGLRTPNCRYPSDLNAQLAVALYYQDETGPAAEKARLALSLYDKHSTARYILGLCYMSNGQMDKAITEFETYISQNPNSDYGYYLKHLACYRNAQYDCALSTLERAMELKPDNRNYLERKVLTLNALKRFAEAEALIQKMVGAIENDPISLLNLGNSYYNQGNYVQALGYLNKAIALLAQKMEASPKFRLSNADLIYNVYLTRGNAYMAMQNYTYALMDYARARDLKPEDFMVYNRMGQLHTEEENWEEAILNYEKAFMYNPGYPIGWVNYGFAHGNLGNNRQSMEVYTQALRIPDVESRGLLLNNRGFAQLEEGYMPESKADLEAAIAEDPEIPMSHISLGEYYLAAKEYPAALEKFNQALGMAYLSQREKHTALHKRGILYEEMGNAQQAEANYRAAIETDARMLDPWQRLGILLYNAGNLCEARKCFQEAIRLDLIDPYVRETRASTIYTILIDKKLNSPCN